MYPVRQMQSGYVSYRGKLGSYFAFRGGEQKMENDSPLWSQHFAPAPLSKKKKKRKRKGEVKREEVKKLRGKV
jgi:hypothetical protein